MKRMILTKRMIHMKRMILTNKMVLMKDNSYNEDD